MDKKLEDWLAYVQRNNLVTTDLEEIKMNREQMEKMLTVAQNMLGLDSEFMLVSPERIISLILRIKELEVKIQELEHS
jgi:hypothetical protein